MSGTRIDRLVRLFEISPKCPCCKVAIVSPEHPFCVFCGEVNPEFQLRALQEAGWDSVEDLKEDQCEDMHDFISMQEVDPSGAPLWHNCPHCGVRVEYKRAH